MVKQGRFFRPRDKNLPQGFDSKMEVRVADANPRLDHHCVMIHYTVEHDYYPDFRLDTGTKHIHIETKGYFQDRAECSKYLWIKKALCDDEELLFVFEKPEKAMHFQRKRKCGTKMSHAEWCERNGFPYCSEAELPQYIIDNWGD